MKYIFIIFFLFTIYSCKKPKCKIIRNDISHYYVCVKGVDTIKFFAFKMPKDFFSDHHPEVLDSLKKLENSGYNLNPYYGSFYLYGIDCDECKNAESRINCDCEQYNY